MIKIDDDGNVAVEGLGKDILAQVTKLSYALFKDIPCPMLIVRAFAMGMAMADPQISEDDLRKSGFSELHVKELMKEMTSNKDTDIFKKMFGDLMNE